MPTDAAAPVAAPTAPAAAAAPPAQMSLLADAAATGKAAAAPVAAPAAASTAPVEPAKSPAVEAKVDAVAKDGVKPDETKDGKAKADAAPVPVDVEIKLPEGMKADALFDGFKAIAKAEGLKGEAAQKVVDLFHAQRQMAMAAAAAARDEQVASMRKAIETDKELGGDHLAETRAVVARVLNDSRTPAEFNELVKDPMLGNHPALVRFLANWGKAIGDDSVEGTIAGNVAPVSLAPKQFRDQVFYDHKSKNKK